MTPEVTERSAIAATQAAHAAYRESLQRWEAWLEAPMYTTSESGVSRPEASNAACVMLDYAIRDIFRRIQKDEWRGDSSLPTSAELEDLLHRERYKSFHAKQVAKRRAVELAAEAVVAMIESEPFIEQFDRQPWYEQITILADLSDRLHESAAGKALLIRQLTGTTLTVHESIPVFDPIRLSALNGKRPVDGFVPVTLLDELLKGQPLSAGNAQRRVLNDAFRYYVNILTVSGSFETAQLGQLLLEWFQFAVTKDVILIQTHPTSGALFDFLTAVDDWRNRSNTAINTTIGPASAWLLFAIAATKGLVATKSFIEDPSRFTTPELLASIADSIGALGDASHKIWRWQDRALRYSTPAAALSAICGILSAWSGIATGIAAWERGHPVQVFAAALSTTGGLTEALIGTLGIARAITGVALLTPAGIIAGFVAVILLEVAGHILYNVAEKGPLKEWFEYNFFGDDWPPAARHVTNPTSMFFRWEHENTGQPRISRQLAELHSLMFPLYSAPDPPEKFPAEVWESKVRVQIDLRPGIRGRDSRVSPFLRGKEVVTIIGFDGITPRRDVLFRGEIGNVEPDPRYPVEGYPLIWRSGQFIERWLLSLLFDPSNLPESVEVRVTGAFGWAPSNSSDFERVDPFQVASVLRRRVDSP